MMCRHFCLPIFNQSNLLACQISPSRVRLRSKVSVLCAKNLAKRVRRLRQDAQAVLTTTNCTWGPNVWWIVQKSTKKLMEFACMRGSYVPLHASKSTKLEMDVYLKPLTALKDTKSTMRELLVFPRLAPPFLSLSCSLHLYSDFLSSAAI